MTGDVTLADFSNPLPAGSRERHKGKAVHPGFAACMLQKMDAKASREARENNLPGGDPGPTCDGFWIGWNKQGQPNNQPFPFHPEHTQCYWTKIAKTGLRATTRLF